MRDLLDRADHFRAIAKPDAATKEWHHFVVHGRDARLIVNFSISLGEGPSDRQLGRLIVLAHHHDWEGWIEEVSVTDIDVVNNGVYGRFGESVIRFVDGGYLVELNIPQRGITGRIRFTPASKPFLKNNQPLGEGRMSWLFVPRLGADGWLQTASARLSMRGAVAYHDHNWGSFRWGDDFGWEWGSSLPTQPAEPWSLVFMRMTDRAHSIARSQCLYVWRNGEPVAMFRDSSVKVETDGFLRRPAKLTLPGVMGLLLQGTASDVPRRLELKAHRAGDHVTVVVEPDEYARVAIPAEIGPRDTVILHEISGEVRAWGMIGNHAIDMEGSGVFELLR